MWNGFWACLDEMRSELITIHKKKSSLWNFKYLQIITSIHVSDGLLRWPNICWTPCLDMYVSTELAPEISCCATSPKASDCRNTDLMKAVLVETHVFVDIHDVSRTSASGIDEQITWLVKTRDWCHAELIFYITTVLGPADLHGRFLTRQASCHCESAVQLLHSSCKLEPRCNGGMMPRMSEWEGEICGPTKLWVL